MFLLYLSIISYISWSFFAHVWLQFLFMELVMEVSAPFNAVHLVISVKYQHPAFHGQVHTSIIPHNFIWMILGNREC